MIRKPPGRQQGDPPLVTVVRAAGSGGRTLITATTHAYWKLQAIVSYGFCGFWALIALICLPADFGLGLIIMALTTGLFFVCRFLLAITKPKSLRDAAARQYQETLAQLDAEPRASVAAPPRPARATFGKRV